MMISKFLMLQILMTPKNDVSEDQNYHATQEYYSFDLTQDSDNYGATQEYDYFDMTQEYDNLDAAQDYDDDDILQKLR